MSQSYHTNAKINSHSRNIIQNSCMRNVKLSKQMRISVKTVGKWRKREFVEDKTSRPKKIHRALSDIERETIRVIRTLTWLELDDLTDSVLPLMPKANLGAPVGGGAWQDTLCDRRVMRGISWTSPHSIATVSMRCLYSSNEVFNRVDFRLACDIKH